MEKEWEGRGSEMVWREGRVSASSAGKDEVGVPRLVLIPTLAIAVSMYRRVHEISLRESYQPPLKVSAPVVTLELSPRSRRPSPGPLDFPASRLSPRSTSKEFPLSRAQHKKSCRPTLAKTSLSGDTPDASRRLLLSLSSGFSFPLLVRLSSHSRLPSHQPVRPLQPYPLLG